MSERTKIEWCDHTWSPWRGCTKVSAGCANCYAEKLSKRNPAVLGQWGKGKPRVLAKDWEKPVRWNRDFTEAIQLADRCFPYRDRSQDNAHRPKVFPSMCDWLDEEVPIEWLARFLQLIHDTPHIDWLLLTKRPENWYNRIYDALLHVEGITDANLAENDPETPTGEMLNQWLATVAGGAIPANVWVGTSVEDQPNADQRIPALLEIPAKVLFLSVEPMLGPVQLTSINQLYGDVIDCLRGYAFHDVIDHVKQPAKIDWVIVGGESGPGARPCDVDWIRDVVRQCAKAGVPCFVKQLGSKAIESDFQHTKECWNEHCALAGGPDDCAGEVVHDSLCLAHPKGGDPDEWPDDLRVRQFPEVVR